MALKLLPKQTVFNAALVEFTKIHLDRESMFFDQITGPMLIKHDASDKSSYINLTLVGSNENKTSRANFVVKYFEENAEPVVLYRKVVETVYGPVNQKWAAIDIVFLIHLE